MSSRSSRYSLEVAGDSDREGILEILESAALEGASRILFTRRPDPLASFRADSPGSRVFVLRDRIRERIALVGASSLHRLQRQGAPQCCGYLHGLRIHPAYRGRLPLSRITAPMMDFLREENTRLWLTSILSDNRRARGLLERNRPGMPVYTPLLDYRVRYLPARPGRLPDTCRRATEADRARIEAFLRRHGRMLEGFPLEEALAGPHGTDRWTRLLVEEDGELLGCCSLIDQERRKQYVVLSYKRSLRLLRSLNPLLPFLGHPELPAAGRPATLRYLGHWLVADGGIRTARRLLRAARSCFRGLLVAGFPVTHPFHRDLRHGPAPRQDSIIYRVDAREPEPPELRRDPFEHLECAHL